MRLLPHSLWLLALGLAFEATVLDVLGCLPRRQGWLAVAWFSLVLIGMIALDGLTILFLYLPILKMLYANMRRGVPRSLAAAWRALLPTPLGSPGD